MLREISAFQVAGEPPRRWFWDPDFDLIVWLGQAQEVLGFQLCYDKAREEHAVSWQPGSGLMHCRVDDGEARPGRHKASPVLHPESEGFDAPRVAREFLARSRRIESFIAGFVHRKLLEHSAAELA